MEQKLASATNGVAWLNSPLIDSTKNIEAALWDPGLVIKESVNHPFIKDALRKAAVIATMQSPLVARVSDALEPGSGEIIRTAAEGLRTAAAMVDHVPFEKLSSKWKGKTPGIMQKEQIERAAAEAKFKKGK